MTKEEITIKAWELLDDVNHLKAWLENPYAFPFMENSRRAAADLHEVQDYLHGILYHLKNYPEKELQIFSISEELERIDDIINQYLEEDLTEEAYLSNLIDDQAEGEALSEEWLSITTGLEEIKNEL